MGNALFPREAQSGGSFEQRFDAAAVAAWNSYYTALRAKHDEKKRVLYEPIQDRNLITTSSEHVGKFEEFWRIELADGLGVPRSEVGKRSVPFTDYRSKSFDVCYPLKGEPKILISVKSMQNAYRNLTNRVEEALGDSALLRIYKKPAAFGFFFFILDGSVARGACDQGEKIRKGIAPFLSLVEDGGDFFDLTELEKYKRKVAKRARKDGNGAEVARLDSIAVAQRSLLDLISKVPAREPDIHYDAMALVAAKMTRNGETWLAKGSEVDPLLDHRKFIARLIEVARLRGLV